MPDYRKYLNKKKHLNPDNRQADWGIQILNLGHTIHPAKRPYPDREHPEPYVFNWEEGRKLQEFQLVYIASGSGIFESEKVGTITVQPGTVFILFPDVWHRYKPLAETGWEEYWVGFSGNYANHLLEQECFNPNFPLLHIGFHTELLQILQRLISSVQLPHPAYSHMSSCLIIQILGLVYASALLKHKLPNRKEQIINTIRYKMHENFLDDLSLEDLAASHHVSYIWFRKAFKEVTGVSPRQYHVNLKIDRAAQLLKETSLSIGEIAFNTGFESESHFSRTFKKKSGVPPSALRLTADGR